MKKLTQILLFTFFTVVALSGCDLFSTGSGSHTVTTTTGAGGGPLTCQTGYELVGATCLVVCSSGQTRSAYTGICTTSCSDGQYLTESGSCVTTCPTGTVPFGGNCVPSCQANATFVNGACTCNNGYVADGANCVIDNQTIGNNNANVNPNAVSKAIAAFGFADSLTGYQSIGLYAINNNNAPVYYGISVPEDVEIPDMNTFVDQIFDALLSGRKPASSVSSNITDVSALTPIGEASSWARYASTEEADGSDYSGFEEAKNATPYDTCVVNAYHYSDNTTVIPLENTLVKTATWYTAGVTAKGPLGNSYYVKTVGEITVTTELGVDITFYIPAYSDQPDHSGTVSPGLARAIYKVANYAQIHSSSGSAKVKIIFGVVPDLSSQPVFFIMGIQLDSLE